MSRKLAVSLLFIPVLSGCAMLNDLSRERRDAPKEQELTYEQEGVQRVVYTPLSGSKPGAHPQAEDMEILLRPPTRAYKEIGLMSIYRAYRDETAAQLFGFVKQRAQMAGADAVLLQDVGGTQVGSVTHGGAIPVGQAVVANSYTTPVIEEAIHAVAIVYEGQ